MADKRTYEQLEQRIQELEQTESKLKGTKKALRESEDQYRRVVDDLPGLICSFLPGYKITFVNKAYCEYFDKTFDELVGSNFLSLIPEADRQTVITNISALNINSPKQMHEHQVIAPAGNIRWHRWTNRALFDSQGKIFHYQSIGEDITEQKLAEKTLRENEKRYRFLADNSTDIISLLSMDGTVLFVSQAVTLLLGYEPKQLLGTNGLDPIIHPADLGRVKSTIMGLLERGLNFEQIEYRIKRKDGNYVWVESTGCLRQSTIDDQSYDIVSVTREITKRKKIEEALNKSHDELEKRVKERTAELSKKNTELELKTKELKDSNTALTVLLKKRELDKIELEEKILLNIESFIEPYLNEMLQNSLSERNKNTLKIIQSNLDGIVSSFARNITSAHRKLTPRELQIANFIRQGKSNKEIAEMLFLSIKTIEFHRDNIRKKLGIKNKKINLNSYLLSIH